MAWQSVFPDGTKSVKDNETIGQQNTTYIETYMNADHFWKSDGSKDGYHRQANMVNLDVDPASLPSLIDGQFYVREKTADEAPSNQLTEPFFAQLNGAGMLYNQLGFRAILCWSNPGVSPIPQANILYSHNIALQSASPKGLVRDGVGLYTINFLNPLPSSNYAVIGTAWRSDAENSLYVSIKDGEGDARSTIMSTTFVKISFQYSGNEYRDPDYASICIVGG